MAIDIAETQDGGVSNLATGKFTGAAAVVDVITGFKPRYIKLVNLTDKIVYEWIWGMAAGHALKTNGADGVLTDEAAANIAVFGQGDDFRGFRVPAAIATNADEFIYIAQG